MQSATCGHRVKITSTDKFTVLWEQLTQRLSGIAVDVQGNIYVTARTSGALMKLSPTGKVLSSWAATCVNS
jgi:sugar lactone lactonase YvrE